MDHLPTRTERTFLHQPDFAQPESIAEAQLFAIQSDERTWRHFPQGLHRELASTRALLERAQAAWARDGVGMWVIAAARDLGGAKSGDVIGSGGVTKIKSGTQQLDPGPGSSTASWWNVGYRLSPAVWGLGLATELVEAMLATAQLHEPEVPVTARVLERNPASIRVLEKAGLKLAWRGIVPADAGDLERATGLERRIYSDRGLPSHVLQALIALG